jgi:hypothetical protein
VAKFFRVSGMFEFRHPAYFIRDPELIKKLAIKDFDYFMDHRLLFTEEMEPTFTKALFALTGQKWKGNVNRKMKFFNQLSFKWKYLSNLQICEQHCRQHSQVFIDISISYSYSCNLNNERLQLFYNNIINRQQNATDVQTD